MRQEGALTTKLRHTTQLSSAASSSYDGQGKMFQKVFFSLVGHLSIIFPRLKFKSKNYICLLPLFVCLKIQQSQQTTPSRVPPTHGLINYIDTKAKYRHLKILTCKGLCGRFFFRVYRLEIQSCHVGIFDPALWTAASLTFSLVSSSPLSWVESI